MILHIEDNKLVRQVVKDTLELEGWRVDVCEDGYQALRLIESSAHYDLILTDDDLPGMDGLALIRRARELPHRRHTPIAMFSASQLERDARHAGADVFLKKPDDITKITEHVWRLLNVWQ